MDFYSIIQNRRSIRKFTQQPIPQEVLLRLVDAARLAPSSANQQPLKYKVVSDPETAAAMQPLVRWAAYLAPHGAPAVGEQPTAFVVICIDRTICDITQTPDAGAAAENILLSAVYEGLGACWMGSIDRNAIHALLHLPDTCFVHTLIALGYPAEVSQTTAITQDIRYYRDENGVFQVPKRTLSDVLL